MPTRTRLKLTGPCLAFVTTTLVDWTPIFDNKHLADTAVDQFRQVLAHYQASCMAYVLMPSHLHAVLGLRDYARIAKFMQGFKILTAKRLKPMLDSDMPDRFTINGGYRFWQPRYDELLIVSEKQFRRKVEYIHANPVKAGLVAKPEDWLYSSAGEWCGKGPWLVPTDRGFLFQR